MADAKPVRIGVAAPAGKPRNTGRPVRAGLVQEKAWDGTPADTKGPRKRGPYRKFRAARVKVAEKKDEKAAE